MEVGGFLVVGPVYEPWAKLQNPLQKGPLAKDPAKNLQFMKTIGIALHEDFLSNLSKDELSIASYTADNKPDLVELFDSLPIPLTAGSLARVCLTDIKTVEVLLKEFYTQLKTKCEEGCHIRLNLKLGWMVC